jgi:transcriptional regulator with XRE-family HTH domain
MNLEAHRNHHGLSYAALASRLGVSSMTAWRWCTRQRTPDQDQAARISAATHGEVSIAELLYPDGVPEGATLFQPPRQRGCALCQGAGEVGGTPCPACVPAVAFQSPHQRGEEAA